MATLLKVPLLQIFHNIHSVASSHDLAKDIFCNEVLFMVFMSMMVSMRIVCVRCICSLNNNVAHFIALFCVLVTVVSDYFIVIALTLSVVWSACGAAGAAGAWLAA